jgi:WD40 repeat protein
MTPEDGEARYLFFAGFRLDSRTGELRRSGRRVKLQSQPARILVLLASRAGELVTREEIQKSLWGEDTFVDFEQGIVAATGSLDGTVRVGRLSGGEPHLLVGHKGAVDYVAISPDLRWVATAGEDNTLRLWPMPDLSKPPLHTLPHDEFLAKLRSLTNLRAVRDPSTATGWKIEVGPFPGWKDVPTW